MEGPKNLFDPEQMADWYVKLCQEHPLCVYIEDPMCEIEGYLKLREKLEALPEVSIGVKASTLYRMSEPPAEEKRSQISYKKAIAHFTQFVEKNEEDEGTLGDRSRIEEQPSVLTGGAGEGDAAAPAEEKKEGEGEEE